jgi:Ca2+-binding RTX toxin-like protein
VVATAQVANVAYFLVPNGGGLFQHTSDELKRPVKVIQLADGTWAVATVGPDGQVETDARGKPNLLAGTDAPALFTETAENAGGVDYASSRVSTQQTPTTLGGDTADGPTGLLAWEDTAAKRKFDGSFGKPGDADYNDAVFNVTQVNGRTVVGTDNTETLTGGKAGDVIFGEGGNDMLDGAEGCDVLYGGTGDDKLNGGAGDDRLDGGIGADRMAGGSGDDTYVVDDVGDAVVEGIHDGADTVLSSLASFTLPGNVESLVFTSSGPFSGTGNSLGNALTGGAGNDALAEARLEHEGVGSVATAQPVVTRCPVEFATVQQLLARTQVVQVGADVVITADTDDAITLQNVSLVTLRAHLDDFRFV